MKNKDQPINPCEIKGRQGFGNSPTIPNKTVYGLTKREHFALELMKATIIGIHSNCPENTHHGWSHEAFANEGIYLADELLKQLDK